MHLLKSSKPQAVAPMVPIVSRWKVPGVRKMRGKHYNAAGDLIGTCGPRKPIPDPAVARAIKEAHEAAAKLPRPQEGGGFDLSRFHPLPNRILVIRGPQIKEEKGIALPEDKWRHEQYYIVVRIGPSITECQVGDRVVFQKKHKPKSVHLGPKVFYIGRETALVAIWETAPSI